MCPQSKVIIDGAGRESPLVPLKKRLLRVDNGARLGSHRGRFFGFRVNLDHVKLQKPSNIDVKLTVLNHLFGVHHKGNRNASKLCIAWQKLSTR